MAKEKSQSRTLKLHKWVGGASSVIATVMSIGDISGYINADWPCIAMFVFLVGISAYGYWLRLHTSEPIK